MRKVLLITLSLVLALAGWTTVCADDGFYVISGVKRNYAPVPKTGQTIPWAAGDDGTLQQGVAWPTPRFTDNSNGTVTDNLTRLIWTKNANAFGVRMWSEARVSANTLQAGYAGLTDGSKAGDWRLPNLRELQSLIDYAFYSPALPNTLGTGKWAEGNPFQGVQSAYYWSSSTTANDTSHAWLVNFSDGLLYTDGKNYVSYRVWCVRGGP